jgi:hypothetical protein
MVLPAAHSLRFSFAYLEHLYVITGDFLGLIVVVIELALLYLPLINPGWQKQLYIFGNFTNDRTRTFNCWNNCTNNITSGDDLNIKVNNLV